ncbi:hypothetical protein PA07A_0786 [Cutibacterium acnes P07A]|nr:hypothetical protein [Cutibacterium acnes P07A]
MVEGLAMVHGGAYQHGVGVARRWGAEIDLGAAQRLQGVSALQSVGNHVSLRLHAL